LSLSHNYLYVGAILLFCIGLYNVIMRRNMVKKLIGLNIMETSVFFFYISLGYLKNGVSPVAGPGIDPGHMVNPVPQVLVLTGIIVAVGVTALALSMVILLYRWYGTLDTDEIMRLAREEDRPAASEEGH
jgi:multicomponent Na+:H+ antiporter subunit C